MTKDLSLTPDQYELLSSLHTNYFTGLNPSTGSTSAETAFSEREDENRLTPPINLPQWACILLPCLTKLPSMQQFQLVKPYDAEVLKGRDKWQCYDSTCVHVGDIVRVTRGDIVPADLVLLSLGMEHYGAGCDAAEGQELDVKALELVVDSKYVTGRERPSSYSIHDELKIIQVDHEEEDSDKMKQHELYCGTQILQGSAIGVVTRIGNDTKLATLIRDGQWPVTMTTTEDSGSPKEPSSYSLVANNEE